MVIDERKQHILTNYQNVKNGGKVVDTDHCTEYMDLDLEVVSCKPERREIFNFKETEGQNRFKELTSKTNEFSACFENNLPLQQQIIRWQATLKSYCKKAFKKIRIKKNDMKPVKYEIATLIDKRNALIDNTVNSLEEKEEIDMINIEIAAKEAEQNRDKIVKNFGKLSKDPENINMSEMWKILKKVFPKSNNSLPAAKKNHRGKIITGAKELKILLAKEYKERLRTRPMRPDMISLKTRRKQTFQLKIKIAGRNQSKIWTTSDLDLALSQLKNNKSRDNDGFVNEIFKKNVIGEDLKKSLLVLCNQLKKKKIIVKFMNIANITTVPKRGSRLLLKNQRGIFRVMVVRAILMRLIYNQKYPEIDKRMSDCQMGGRKNKGCKNNLFIINGIIHEVLKSKKMKPVMLQFYDYSQMFDSINLEQAISDIFDTGVNDDNLVLLYKANCEVDMAVRTTDGLSERQMLENIVLQGDTWGSILASNQVDMIGKESMEAGHYYLYKNILPVGFLGLVDDIVGITEAGFNAQQFNVFINVKTAEKTLQFGPSKCKSMLIGKQVEDIHLSDIEVDSWRVEHQINTQTGVDELIEHYDGKVSI